MEEPRFKGTLSSEYDELKLVVPHYNKMQETLVDIASEYCEGRKSKLLEVGTGTGVSTKAILENFQDVNIISIDNEPQMMEQARINLADYFNRGIVNLVEEDALKFLKKQDSDSYDGFFSAYTLHNFDQRYREKFLEELTRVLRPGAFFVNSDKYAHDNPIKQKEELEWQLNEFLKFDEIGKPELRKEWSDHIIADEHEDLIMRQGKSINLMKNLGYENIRLIFRQHMEATLACKKSHKNL